MFKKILILFFVSMVMFISCDDGVKLVVRMVVKQGTTILANNTGTYDFGNVNIGTSSAVITFTIENTGNTNLLLTGTPNKIVKDGGDAAMFAINQTTTNSPVAKKLTTTFTITFTPTSSGLKSTTISIANNTKNDDPYRFTIRGTGQSFIDMNIKQGTTDIALNTGSYDFGSIGVGESSSAIVFTIENLGTTDLLLTGTPKVGISGIDAAQFSVNQAATTSPVIGGGSTTFTVTFSPTSAGNKTATISIANNDSPKNPYNFSVRGEGYVRGSAIGWIGGGSNGWKTSNAPGPGSLYQSFRSPVGVFVDSLGNIYVADRDNNRVSKWGSNGNAIGWIGGGSNGWKTGNAPASGNGYQSFSAPNDVYVDSDGNIYVSEMGNYRISKWDSNGVAIGWIGGGSNGWKTTPATGPGNDYQSFAFPFGITLDSSGNIYIADLNANRISKWGANGNAIGWIGGGSNGWKTTTGASPGTSYQSFYYPAGVTLDSTGNIYVADMNNYRISKWDSSGNAIGWIGGGSNGWKTTTGATHGTSYQSFGSPAGVIIDSTGNIYVVDHSNHRISKWSSSGNAIGWIGGGSSGWKTGTAPASGAGFQSFNYPVYLCLHNGYIYVSEWSNQRISKWRD